MAGPWSLIPLGISMAMTGVRMLTASHQSISQTEPVVAGLKFTTSAFGLTRTVLYGQGRITGNMIWYGDYYAIPNTTTTEVGGKGGGQDYSNTSWTYQCSFALGLCEGEIIRIVKAWAGDSVTVLVSQAGASWVVKTGSATQTPWTYLTSYHPTQAIRYPNLAYVAMTSYQLGSYPTMPNFSFIVEGKKNYYGETDTANETHTIDSSVTVYQSTLWEKTNSVIYSEATVTPDITPTYVDPATFSMPGDATSLFVVGRTVAITILVFDSMAWDYFPTVVTATVAFSIYGAGVTTVYLTNLNDAVLTDPVSNVSVTGGPFTFVAVSSSPKLGEYSESEGVYSFNTAEAGSVVINYDHLVTCGGRTSEIIADIITNAFFGLGQSSAVIDFTTFDFDDYCLANEYFLSPVFSSQSPAKDVVELLLKLVNAEVLWGDGKLIFVPLGDESATSTYGSYTPDTTAVVQIGYDDILDKGADSLTVNRGTAADAFNHVAIQHVNKDNDYNTETTEYQDQGDMITNGKRSMGTLSANGVTTKTLALKIGRILCKRSLRASNKYSFSLPLNFIYLRPLDIVGITSAHHGLTTNAVRLTNLKIGQTEIAVEAEDLGLGSASVPAKTITRAQDNYCPTKINDPGDAYAPVVFSPPLYLANYEIWLATAGGADWGGSKVWVSQDGATYALAGTMVGASRYGVISDPGYLSREYFNEAYWDENYWDLGSDNGLPAAVSSPDTTNVLHVDLSVSKGTLTSGTEAQADSLQTLCYVDGEYISFKTATLRGTNIYDLTYLVRGCYGTSMASHDAGTDFVRLDAGIFKYPFNPNDIGKTIYIKLQSFNTYGKALQDLADLSAIAHTIESPGTQTGRGVLNLSVGNNAVTPNTKLDVAFDACDVSTSNGNVFTAGKKGFTINFGTSGANGLDTGSIAANTWYYFYAVANTKQSTVAGLASLSSSAPTMPTGYTYKAVIGAVTTDGAAHIIDVNQVDYELFYSQQQVHTTRVSAQIWDDINISGLVPPIATRAWITIEVTAAASEVTVGARKNGSSGDGQIGGKVAAGTTGIISGWVNTDLDQKIELYISPTPTTWTLSVNGFRFNV